MTVFAYLFLAPSRDHRVSLAEQQEGINAFAHERGLQVDDVLVEEHQSLKTPLVDRPQGQALLALLQPQDTVLVLKTEWVLGSARAGGKLLDELRKRKVRLYGVDLGENISLPEPRRLAVTEGNAALIRRLLHCLSSCESTRHGEVIKAGKRMRRQQGRFTGGPVPFGWQVDAAGFLRPHPGQQEVIGEIRRMRAAGQSLRGIAEKLRERGIALSHEGVRRILANDRQRMRDGALPIDAK